MFAAAQTPDGDVRDTASMSDASLRRVVMLAIVLLVLHAVGAWAYAALGVAAAIVSVLLVGAVSLLSARLAGLGEGNHAWFVVPIAVFAGLPLAGRLWTLLTVELTPFVAGFAAPVLLLLAAYLELGRRARHSAHAPSPIRTEEPLLTRKSAI
jgi:hypothetical protein